MSDATRAERSWPRQLVRFALVGIIGFLVDSASLTAFLAVFPGHFYSGRAVSYLLAASTTWALNAVFTFGRTGEAAVRQWGRFVLFNLGGGAVNYGVYAVLVGGIALVARQPVLAVAAGSIAGLGVNFLVSRHFVFGRGAGRA